MRNAISFFIMLLFCAAVPGICSAQEELTPKQAKAKFEKADRALNEAWAAAKAALSEAEFDELKKSQRTWVEHRDYLARSPLYTGSDAQGELALDSTEYLSAAAELEDMRTEWLKGLVKERDAEDAITGVWTDSYGGRIEIVEQQGELFFVMECVRGPSFHIGGLTGVGAWNQSIGWFSDKGRDKEREDVTNLSFILHDRQLQVIGANTSYYHGARAYFDGHYVKVEPLGAKEKAKVVKAAKTGEIPETE